MTIQRRLLTVTTKWQAIPQCARVLSAAYMGNRLLVWYVNVVSAPTRYVRIKSTSGVIEPNEIYIGTAIDSHELRATHVFLLADKEPLATSDIFTLESSTEPPGCKGNC